MLTSISNVWSHYFPSKSIAWEDFRKERPQEYEDIMKHFIIPKLRFQKQRQMRTFSKAFEESYPKDVWKLFYTNEDEDREKYVGNISKFLKIPHGGKGEMIRNDSNGKGWTRYVGEWDIGLRNGHGKIWYHGRIYNFELNSLNEYIEEDDGEYTNGSYEGGWTNGKKDGKGIRIYKLFNAYKVFDENVFVYDGLWKLGKKDGKWKGKLHIYNQRTDNYDIYEGEWLHGKPDGMGKMRYQRGYHYDGEWKNGKREGYGVETWTKPVWPYNAARNRDSILMKWNHGREGEVYKGQWHEDKKHRKGKMIYKNGDVYDGDWDDDEKDGQGKMIYKNGDVYDGDWEDDEKDGVGTTTYKNGDMYIGIWRKDKKHGKGTIYYVDGTKYKGQWTNDHRDDEFDDLSSIQNKIMSK